MFPAWEAMVPAWKLAKRWLFLKAIQPILLPPQPQVLGWAVVHPLNEATFVRRGKLAVLCTALLM